MRTSQLLHLVVTLTLIVLLAAACGLAPTPSPAPTQVVQVSKPTLLPPTDTPIPPTATPTATPTPISVEDLVARNKAALAKVTSMQLQIIMDIEMGGQSVSTVMSGTVKSPEEAYFTWSAGGQEGESIVIGEQMFSRQSGSEIWVRTEQSGATADYEAQLGFGEFAQSLVLEGEETLGGVATYVLTFDVDLAEFFKTDPSMAAFFDPLKSSATGKAWIGKEDLYTHKLILTMSLESAGDELSMDMTMTAGDWNGSFSLPEPSPSIGQKPLQVGDPVFEVVFSPDSTVLAASDDDQTIYLWSTANLDADPETIIHPDLKNNPQMLQSADFYSLAFSPDGKTLAAGSKGKVYLYAVDDLAADPRVLALDEPEGGGFPDVEAVAFSPNGKYLAAGGVGSVIHVWSMAKMDDPAQKLAGHEGDIIDLTFTPDGKSLISAGEDGQILVWSVSDLKAPPKVLTGNEGPVYRLAITPDEKFLLSAGFENPILAWSLENLDNQPEHMIPRSDPTTGKMPTLSIAISPDGETLATGDVPGTIRLWHMADPQTPFFTAQAHGQYDIMAIAFSSDGRFLASGGGDAVVNVWELTPEE